jgi:hypothetical protein
VVSNQAMVTAADIARLAGVGRAAVSNWRRRYADFPQPVGGTPNSPLFRLAEIQGWLRAQDKLHQASPWEPLWQLVEAHRGEHEPAEILSAIGAFLLYLETTGRDGWPQLRAQPDDALAKALPRAVKTATANLADFGRWTVSLDADRARLFRDIADLAHEHGAADTFTGLWERFVQANTRWISVTPPGLAGLMTEIAGVHQGTVLDPACGTGSLLAAALTKPGVRGFGQEIDPGLARLATIRLALLGGGARVHAAGSLLADGYQGLLFDAVLCDPPFNERQWGHDELVYDERWEYGIPPRMESELAWVQHALAHVVPGGTVVMCMPPSAASRRSGRRIRAELLRRGALRAVIALPAALAPVHLWILRRDDPGTHLLVVDTNTPDWGQTTELVVGAWRGFTDPTRTVTERPGEVRTVPVIDLLGEDVDLTPARNLPVSAAPGSPEQLLTRHRELAAKLTELTERLPVVDWLPAGERRVATTVAELAKSGAVAVLASTPTGEPAGYGEPTTPFLEVEELVSGHPPARRVPGDVARTCVLTQPGDVVVPMVGRQLVARVVVDGGIALAKGLCALRPNPVALDPWFLAGFLSSSMSTRQASTHLSSAARLDVRRCEIPRLPLGEQRRYAVLFRQLATFDAMLTAVTGLAREVVQATTDGLTEGIIAPPM